MCKLIIGIKNNKNNEQFEQLLKMQQEEIVREPDGISGLVITNDGEVKIFRSFINYHQILNDVYSNLDNAKVVALHTRTGTSGSKDITNVHFFEHENWIFAHNGFVGKYSTYENRWDWHGEKKMFIPKTSMTDEVINAQETFNNCHNCGYFCESGFTKDNRCKQHKKEYGMLKEFLSKFSKPSEKFCDSFQFLQALEKEKITPQYLTDELNKQQFTGIALLLNTETKKGYLLVKNKEAACAISDEKTYSMFFSYEPELKASYPEFAWLNGIAVVKGEEEVEIDVEPNKIVQGVYEFNFDKISQVE